MMKCKGVNKNAKFKNGNYAAFIDLVEYHALFSVGS